MINNHNCTLYSGTQIAVGIFDCPLTSPDFSNTGPISDYLLAFPRSAVKIRHYDSSEVIIADANVVTIYNKGQEYERKPLSSYGDYCHWLAMTPELLEEIQAELDVPLPKTPRKLLSVSYGRSSADAYMRVQALGAYLNAAEHADTFAVEECVIGLVATILTRAYRDWGIADISARHGTRRQHKKLVDDTRAVIAMRYREALTLEHLANEVNTSAYHLCRIFRRLTGITMYRYIKQLRLRDALQQLASGCCDLATLSIEAGFSDHSHFSSDFRKAMGITPSQFRQMSKTLPQSKNQARSL